MNANLHRRPLWWGVLIAPFAVPSAYLLYIFFALLIQEGFAGLKDWEAAVGFWIFGIVSAYIVMFLVGLPYLFVLKRLQRFGWLEICAGATVFGGIAFPIIMSWNLITVLIGCLLGLVCGVTFCLIIGLNPLNSKNN